MRRLHTGVIILDAFDILCISFSLGSGLAYLVEIRRKKQKNLDPIISELKRKSPIIQTSTDRRPSKVLLVRGGETIKGIALAIKSKRLAALIRAIITAKRQQKLFKLLQINFAILNAIITSSVGINIAIGGSFQYTQIFLIAVPATAGGFIFTSLIGSPLAVVLPLAIFFNRGIEDIPDPYEKCRLLCKAAEKFHNKQLAIEMVKLNSLVEDTSTVLQLPLDKVPLVCVEEKLSLLQRFKLRKLVESGEIQNRVQHFNEFIKKFPECDVDPEAVYEEVVKKIT